jgi:hypothetical protein
MKRTLPYLIVAVLTFVVSIITVRIVDMRMDREPIGVGPINLMAAAKCLESPTNGEFAVFWIEFRGAVKASDKTKVFSMTRACSFEWYRGNQTGELRQPLASTWESIPFELSPPFEVRPLVRNGTSGGSFVFQSKEDFLANYDVIFSKRIARQILSGSPANCEGIYEIRWRDDGLNSLRFDCLEDGCKFKGLQWEP